MNKTNSFQDQITILIVLYKEKYEMVSNCLKNIKNFKVIIIDNANDINLKKRISKEFKIYKYILNKKILDLQVLLLVVLINAIQATCFF